MKLTTKLALSQLKENRKRTILTLLGIVLSVAMITAVFGFVASGRNAIYNLVLSRGNYHVAYGNLAPAEAETLAADPAFESHYTQVESDGAVTLYARLAKPSGNVWGQMHAIIEAYNINDFSAKKNTQLLALEGHVPDEYTIVMFTIAGVLFLVIMVASVIVISNAFRVSAGERIKQFGILKSVGATARQIRSTVVSEGLLLAFIGIPIGIGIGLGVEAVGCALAGHFLVARNKLNDMQIHMDFAAPWWVIVLAAVLALLTIFLSAYLPARKAAKIPAIDAIRGKGEVKLKAKKVRGAVLTRKIFGVEGQLASTFMKRSRRNYRATVIALASSVVLFLVGVSFGDSLMTQVTMLYPGVDATAYVSLSSYSVSTSEDTLPPTTSAEAARTVTERLQTFDREAAIKMVGGNAGLEIQTTDTDIWSDAGRIAIPEAQSGRPVLVIYLSLDDAFYAELCKQANVPEGANIRPVLKPKNMIY
ncbi:MAG: ABC transporter permease [Clostridiales bacterium]|jgi:cell division protein FtsX|nr:ABC transporter permease [Clostridiales bacterium]